MGALTASAKGSRRARTRGREGRGRDELAECDWMDCRNSVTGVMNGGAGLIGGPCFY